MPVTILDGHQVHVDAEGFLTDLSEWDDELARPGGPDRPRPHRRAPHRARLPARRLRGARRDRDLRRASAGSGVPVKDLFRLFPQKPAKKMAYVAGLPKPGGCV